MFFSEILRVSRYYNQTFLYTLEKNPEHHFFVPPICMTKNSILVTEEKMASQQHLTISSALTPGKLPQLAAVYLIDEEHNNKYSRLLHSHRGELELYFAFSGEGHYIVDGRPYAIQQGDMVICNAGVLHGDDHTKDRNLCSYCCALTNVSFQGLPDNWLTDGSISPVISCGAFAEKIGSLMELIYMLSLDMDRLSDVCNSFAVSLLLLTRQLVLSKERNSVRRPQTEQDFIAKKIQSYLDAHYRQKLTLESIAAALELNPSYVSHIFKQEMVISPIQYVLHRKFGEAQGLLMDTELSVNEISDLLGFAGTAHFNAMFKKHVGITPGQYRKSIKEMNS